MRKRYLIAVAILLVFCLLMFLVTHFSPSTVLSTEGYFVSGEEIEEVLLTDKKIAKSKNIKLEKVTYEDNFYNNLDNLYVGEEEKRIVNNNYPVFSNDGVAIVNINEKSKLVNNKFEYLEGYENFTLTGGKLYNYGDLEQADFEDYLFLQSANGTYVNLYPMKITSNNIVHEIPVNSIIAFYEGYLKFFVYDNSGKLIYNIDDGIDLYSEVTMGETKFTYKKLLTFIGKIEDASGSGSSTGDEVVEEEVEDEKDPVKVPENKYVKPTVKAENFTTKVYSAKSKLSISDPSGVISGGITFQFKVGDKIYLRKSFASSGEIQITGLVPNTKFQIIGSFKYYNEESKKMEMTFFEQTVTTAGLDGLGAVDLAFENGPIYSDKIELRNIRITSNLKSEAIYGITKGIIYINGEEYSIPTALVKELVAGRSITYISPASVDSCSILDYEIKLFDAYGNAIKTNNGKGQTRTSKVIPTAVVKQTDGSVTSINFNINLKNPDNVNIGNYRYVIYDRNMSIVLSEELDNIASQEIVLEDLDPNSTYSIKVIGDFDIEDGSGVVKDSLLGEGKFTTLPLSSLGYLRVKTGTKELTSSHAILDTYVDTSSTSAVLLTLINKYKVSVLDGETVIYTKTYEGEELATLLTGEHFYDRIDNLVSGTEYSIVFESTAKQGTVEEVVPVLYSFKSFICYKQPASIAITNKFVTGSMIDFDVQVIDTEHTILSNRVILEVRDATGKLVKMEYLDVNSEPVQLNYDHLDEAVDYTFTYKAESYNEGYDNRTFKSDYVIYSEIVHTEPGLVGSLQLMSLLRQVESKNLFNITDYDRIRKEGSTYYKNYDIENNTLSIGAKNGYVNVSYFVPEAYNRDVVVTFYARYKPGTVSKAPVYLAKGFTDNRSYSLDDLTEEYKPYTFSFKSTSNYIGFNIIETANKNLRTDLDIKDLNIVDVTSQGEDALSDISYSYHSSGYRFTDTLMYGGDEEMPSHSSESLVVGNAGNGFARITNLSTGDVFMYDYTGDVQEFKASQTASYRVELWGASGGDSSGATNPNASSRAGYGAYTAGTVTIKSGTTLYLYVGGAGVYSSSVVPSGGYNGGGAGGLKLTGSGGGATDIRTKNGVWNDETSLKSRIMVAAGGGGSDNSGGTKWGNNDGSGGPGGTLTSKGAYVNGVLKPEFGVSQVGGNALGQGQNGLSTETGGAGGGYYGGLSSANTNGGGSGGSSYISGHVGCVSELDTAYTKYVEKAQYAGTINILLQDSNDELVNNDYYVRVYKKGDLVKTFQYDLVNNSANHNEIYQLDKNKDYTLRLCVKVRERFYDLALLEFNTSSEIRSITSVSGFTGMHNNGRYIVLNDLEFMSTSKTYGYYFYGELDFQGHTIKTNTKSRSSYLLYALGSGGTVKNLVMDYYLDSASARSYFYGFVYTNYGTIDNLMINVKESIPQANSVFSLVTYYNYGTIKNFVVNSAAPVSGKQTTGILVWSNNGTIKNGYLYGEHMYGYFENNDRSRKDMGPVAGQASTNSRVSNVFSLIGVVKDSTLDSEKSVSNLIGYSGAGQINNVYSVEDASNPNTNLSTQDPNIGTISGGRFKNMYYSSDTTYTGGQSIKISKLALRDTDFQKSVLNSDEEAFDVDSYVPFGYYPQVIMNDCMPRQEMLELPSVADADLVDITSSEQLTVNGDSAEIMLTLNNPGAEEIASIGIKDINTVEIINQEDSYGKTKLHVRVSNPSAYKSRYYIRQIKVNGASNFTYTRDYGDYERSVDIDLYLVIDNLTEWKLINENPNQNYMLNTDLDFSVEPIERNIITKEFKGKLNGNGHTLKNIIINNSSYKGFFNSYITGGTIENLNVENFVKLGETTYSGFIYYPRSGSVIDNVHLNNVEVDGVKYVGGLVSYAYGSSAVTIKNSSVTNVKVIVPGDKEIVDVYAGGMAAYVYEGDVFNSYVQNVDVQVPDVLSSAGVGGMIGYQYIGSIKNCYATGKVYNNSVNTGGIIGSYDTITINSVWSNVNLNSKMDYLGGIYGKRSNSIIENTFVAGTIYSSYESNYVNRTGGNSTATPMNNYAWDRQKFMGFIVGDSKIETFLTREDLMESSTYLERIGFDDNFSYEEISNGSLPKLKHSETGEVFKNQIDSFLVEDPISVNSDAISIADGVTSSEISITFNNPNNYEIKSLDFDYLNIKSYLSNVTVNGVSTIRFEVTPERSYDSYMLESLTYVVGDKEEVLNLGLKIEKTFYNQINSVDQWNAAARLGTEENYLLTADLDFTDKTVTPNAKFGRLEGQGERKIKNVTMTSNTDNYSMIKLLTKTLTDITFENINISSTKTSGNYVSIINLNYANIERVKFIDIKIDAPKISYVAPISRHRGESIREIELSGTKTVSTEDGEIYSYLISGNQYVGGFIAYAYAKDTFGITADTIKVTGRSSYVGGVIGANDYNSSNKNNSYTISNVHVEGTGYVGAAFGRGGANESRVTNAYVYGKGESNYIGGFSGYSYQYTVKDVMVSDSTILGNNHNYVGGMFGWAYDTIDVYVFNSTVTQNGAGKKYVGGLIGDAASYTTNYWGVENTTITNAGTGTGGGFGSLRSRYVRYGYTKDVTVNGVDRVGGLAGYTNRARAYYNTVNSTINSTGTHTGGVVGYISDIDPDSATYSSQIQQLIMANTNITTTGTGVGLFAGYTRNKLTTAAFYKLLLVGNIVAPESATVGVLSGNDIEQETDYMTKIYVYDKSSIMRTNGEDIVSSTYVGDMTDTYKYLVQDANIANASLVDAANLRVATFWTDSDKLHLSTSYWATSWTSPSGEARSVALGYYPRNKYTYSYYADVPDFELPTETVTYGMMYSSVMLGHELPEVNVYSSGITSLNIEFDEVDDLSYFEVYEDKKLIFKQDIDKRTYSITYNYKSDLEIVVSDGTNKDTHYYSASDLVNKVTTYDNTYAYIYEGKLTGNIEESKDKFIHVYGHKALTENLNVYNIKTSKFISVNNTFGVSLLNDTIPLFEFDYDKNVTIDTYATYSIINKDGQDILYENQIFVKNGVVEIVDSELDNVKNSIIVDEYAKDNYVTVLGDDGVIYDLKESIKLPSAFTNKNIEYMSNNINSKSSVVVIMYKSGKAVVFDYRTGKRIKEQKATEDISVVDYFIENMKSGEKLIGSDLTNSYNESLKLKGMLEKTPIVEGENGNYVSSKDEDNKTNNTNNKASNYVTYYDSTKAKYDVVDIGTVIENNEEEVVAETDKIYSSNKLVNFYMQESLIDKIFGDVNVLIIFAIILVGIVSALGLWLRNISKLKESES